MKKAGNELSFPAFALPTRERKIFSVKKREPCIIITILLSIVYSNKSIFVLYQAEQTSVK